SAKLRWPLPDGWNDTHLEAALYPSLETKPQPQKSAPDFAAIHEQLRTHRHVTLQLLWEEYREINPDGYRYSRYVATAFMFSSNAGSRRVLFRRRPTATLIGSTAGPYRPLRNAINEGRCVRRGSASGRPLISTLANAVAFISRSTSAYT